MNLLSNWHGYAAAQVSSVRSAEAGLVALACNPGRKGEAGRVNASSPTGVQSELKAILSYMVRLS